MNFKTEISLIVTVNRPRTHHLAVVHAVTNDQLTTTSLSKYLASHYMQDG